MRGRRRPPFLASQRPGRRDGRRRRCLPSSVESRRSGRRGDAVGRDQDGVHESSSWLAIYGALRRRRVLRRCSSPPSTLSIGTNTQGTVLSSARGAHDAVPSEGDRAGVSDVEQRRGQASDVRGRGRVVRACVRANGAGAGGRSLGDTRVGKRCVCVETGAVDVDARGGRRGGWGEACPEEGRYKGSGETGQEEQGALSLSPSAARRLRCFARPFASPIAVWIERRRPCADTWGSHASATVSPLDRICMRARYSPFHTQTTRMGARAASLIGGPPLQE